MPREKDWSSFASDDEARMAYVVGPADLDKFGGPKAFDFETVDGMAVA